jgi:thymidine kinase
VIHYLKINSKMKGRTEMIVGPMFSGKTSELLRRLKKYEISGSKIVLVKHRSD